MPCPSHGTKWSFENNFVPIALRTYARRQRIEPYKELGSSIQAILIPLRDYAMPQLAINVIDDESDKQFRPGLAQETQDNSKKHTGKYASSPSAR